MIGLQYPASTYSLFFSGEQEKLRIDKAEGHVKVLFLYLTKEKGEKGPLDCKINLLIELLDYFIATSNFGLLNVTKFDSLNVEITLKE